VNYSLRLRPELVDDVHEAFAWYEAAGTGLGHEFLRGYFAALAIAQREPLLFQQVYQEFRRVLLKRFPYALYFRIEGQTVVAFLVIHGARNPKLIKTYLRKRKRTPDSQ
jgi:plasmid stabilization system protein ParE